MLQSTFARLLWPYCVTLVTRDEMRRGFGAVRIDLAGLIWPGCRNADPGIKTGMCKLYHGTTTLHHAHGGLNFEAGAGTSAMEYRMEYTHACT